MIWVWAWGQGLGGTRGSWRLSWGKMTGALCHLSLNFDV